MKNEKKLVEAFKAFMENGVIPCLPEDHIILNEWKFLSGILTLEPIDQNQIDFYLLMANKNTHHKNISMTKSANQLDTQPKEQQNLQLRKQGSLQPQTVNTGEQKINTKKLLASMQSFQGVMIKNQEKLESISKKDTVAGKGQGGVNTSIQGKKNG